MGELQFYDEIIIGAGVAGLTLAYKLKKQEKNFVLLETSNRVGGSFCTKAYKNSLYEFGPNTFLSNHDEVMELVREIDLEADILATGFKDSRRFLFFNGDLHEVESGIRFLLNTKLISLKSKLSLLKEPFIKALKKDESVHEFISRRLGEEFSENVVSSFLQGIWGGDSRKLSARAALKFFKEKEERYGSIFSGLIKTSQKKSKRKPLKIQSFKNGMTMFPERLAERAGRENILLDTSIQAIWREGENFRIKFLRHGQEEIYESSKLRIASKGYEASGLLEDLNPKLSSLLSEIEYAPVALLALSLPKDSLVEVLDGFGFLFATAEESKSLGSIWSSELFPERNLEDEYLMVCLAGGAKNTDIRTMSETELVNHIIDEQIPVLSKYANRMLSKLDFKVVDYKFIDKAIPQYNLGHPERLEKIEAELENFPGLYLYGNYLYGVSVADTIKRSFLENF
jgi:protoporphyrinogen/coproporphyrinogen III oxidase